MIDSVAVHAAAPSQLVVVLLSAAVALAAYVVVSLVLALAKVRTADPLNVEWPRE